MVPETVASRETLENARIGNQNMYRKYNATTLDSLIITHLNNPTIRLPVGIQG